MEIYNFLPFSKRIQLKIVDDVTLQALDHVTIYIVMLFSMHLKSK